MIGVIGKNHKIEIIKLLKMGLKMGSKMATKMDISDHLSFLL